MAMAQPITTIGTYYVTPPSNGCNGVWAAGPIPFGQCTAPYTYSVNPPGCFDGFIGTSGDTLFISLCSIPCEMIMIDEGGGTCFICDLSYDVTTGTEEETDLAIEVYPNPVEHTLKFRHKKTEQFSVKLFDAVGRLVFSRQIQPYENTMDVSFLKPGVYYLSFESKQRVGMRVIEIAH